MTADPHVSSSRERKARRGPTTSPAGPGLVVRKANSSGLGFCDACFSGHYPVPVDAGVTKEEYDA